MASHGAALGVLMALYIYSRVAGDSFIWLLDRVAFLAVMGGAIIRVGNFFNSEILGTVTDQPWGIIFARVDSHPRHPVQLYEAISYALIFCGMIPVYRKTLEKPAPGLLLGLFCLLVFSARFGLEFFKTEQAMYDTGLPFTTGQLLSVPFIALGAVLVFRALRRQSAANVE